MSGVGASESRHGTMQGQFWQINYCAVADKADAICGARIMRGLLAVKCRAHKLSDYAVYIEEHKYVEDEQCQHDAGASSATQETKHRVFALTTTCAIPDYELLAHFTDCPRILYHEDYSYDVSKWTFQALTATAYEDLREQHAHNEY